MSIQFKDRVDEPKWPALDFRLRWLAELADLWFGLHDHSVILVTDVDTPGIHMDGSPHYDHRGLDLRLPGTLAEAEAFADWLNRIVTYDGTRVCVLVGKYDPHHQHDDHIHLQVPGPYRPRGRVRLRAEE